MGLTRDEALTRIRTLLDEVGANPGARGNVGRMIAVQALFNVAVLEPFSIPLTLQEIEAAFAQADAATVDGNG